MYHYTPIKYSPILMFISFSNLVNIISTGLFVVVFSLLLHLNYVEHFKIFEF